ncbi:MAG: hypothetical protein M1815_002196 [Lichina confinis]|nr:MAG: hypothetical protein M1815_002196 [Lichina confinis]
MCKSQLLRRYASLLRSTPMMVMFQHNNVKSVGWMGTRREMLRALRKVDELEVAARGEGEGDDAAHASPSHIGMADKVKIQTVQTGIFDVTLRVVEYYRPAEQQRSPPPPAPTTTTTTTSTQSTNPSPPSPPISPETRTSDPNLISTHALSRAAHQAASQRKGAHPLSPLLSGPLALLTFPGVSPEHLRAALSILSPQSPVFAAPTRRANPGYHEASVQQGLQKLLLLGARVEGRALDAAALRAVGTLHGDIDALRAQLVVALQGVGLGVTSSLESAGSSLYLTLQEIYTVSD